MDDPRVRPAGDAAVVVDMGDRIDRGINRRVHVVARQVRQLLAPLGVVEVTPGYTNLLISYDPASLSFERLSSSLTDLIMEPTVEAVPRRRVTLPVVYGGAYGPDLDEVARYHGVTPEEIIGLHAGRDYPIFCLGFSPGFPLLGGLDEALHTPRLETPRARVPAGSVAIGGSQTGVYPTSTPGGWRLIGRTPLVLFDLRVVPPVPYEAQDLVRFEPISGSEYEDLLRQRKMPESEPAPLEA